MQKQQILLLNKYNKKNLNIICSLTKQSNNLYNPYTAKVSENLNLYDFFSYDLVSDKTIYYNQGGFSAASTLESIKSKLFCNINLMDKKLSFINFLHDKLWSLNRITYLSVDLSFKNNSKRLLFPNRVVKDSKTLLKKIYKNIKYMKEDSAFISYWHTPIIYKYNNKKNYILMLFRNNFNRILVNNLINLFCPDYFRIFFNIFRHFTKLISKRLMLLYLNDYNFFNFFIKKKHNILTIKWFRIFSTVSDDSTEKLYYTNYVRPTMFRRDMKLSLVNMYRKKQTHMYSWLYMISIQEILKKFDLKLFYIIKYIYLMRGKRYKRIFEQSRRLVFISPINNKRFLIELVNIFCVSMRTKDPKFIFDFLFKYFNTMHFRLQFKFISFLKSFIRQNFLLFVDYYRIRGIRILIKGKIGKTGSVRKKKILLSFGKIGYSNLRLRMDESVGPMLTPTGVIGARIIISY